MALDTQVIACDGPSGAGKGELGKKLEANFGIIPVNTGLIYRGLSAVAMRELGVESLIEVPETEVVEALSALEPDALSTDFRSDFKLHGEPLQGLYMAAMQPQAAHTSSLQGVRDSFAKPMIRRAIDASASPYVYCEGRDEGLVWRNAGRLSVALFLSVSPFATVLERHSQRRALQGEAPLEDLRPAIISVMEADYSNITRAHEPTFVDPNGLLLREDTTEADVNAAVAEHRQIMIPTDGRTEATVYGQVVDILKVAGVVKA